MNLLYLCAYLELNCHWVTAASTLGLFLATFCLILVALIQLKKTRDATNSDSLNEYIKFFRSKEMSDNRKKLANYIKDEGYEDNKDSKIKTKLAKLKNETCYNQIDREWISNTKNVIENVIYNFEILGFFTMNKKIYSPNDTYQLFSYEIQQYWVLLNDFLGYIDFIRTNEFSGEKDLYVKFENVFYKMMVLEVLSLEDGLGCFVRWKYKFLPIKKIKNDDRCKSHINNKIRYTPLFLDEERNI